ncbi:MAG: OmpA family protein [Paludibacteraceae bacterium]
MKRVLSAIALLGIGVATFAAAGDVKYNSRHFVDVWGGAGYSSLLHNVENASAIGGGGVSLGTAYEWSYKRFLLSTGVEFSYLNSTSKVNPFTIQAQLLYEDPYHTGYMLDYYCKFDNYRDVQHVGFLNIPILFGGKFDRYYFLAGGKIGVGLFGTSVTQTALTTTITDPALVGEFTDMPTHGLFTDDYRARNAFSLAFDVKATAEFGLILDEWLPKKMRVLADKRKTPVSYRIGLFCDYGVTNLHKNVTDATSLAYIDGNAAETRYVTANSLFASAEANDKRLNSLFAGVKFTVLFQVGKEPQKKPKALPNPLLILTVYDKDTQQPIEGALLSAYNNTARRMVINNRAVPKNGLTTRVVKGDYTLTVTKKDYDTTTADIQLLQLGDTMATTIYLKHRPIFSTEIVNAETNNKLSAKVTITNATTGAVAYAVLTDSVSGACSVTLPDGNYTLAVEKMGYETYQSDIQSIGDHMLVRLTPLRKGEKVVLHNLFFATNKTTILPQSEAGLEELYRFLTENPEVRIKIVGHTDDVGTTAHNDKLSQGRANSVRQSMIERGIAPERIEFEGRGSREPVAPNDTEEGRSLNRRVEFEIL